MIWAEAKERLERHLANPSAVLSNGALIGGIIQLADLRLALSRVEALEGALTKIAAIHPNSNRPVARCNEIAKAALEGGTSDAR